METSTGTPRKPICGNKARIQPPWKFVYEFNKIPGKKDELIQGFQAEIDTATGEFAAKRPLFRPMTRLDEQEEALWMKENPLIESQQDLAESILKRIRAKDDEEDEIESITTKICVKAGLSVRSVQVKPIQVPPEVEKLMRATATADINAEAAKKTAIGEKNARLQKADAAKREEEAIGEGIASGVKKIMDETGLDKLAAATLYLQRTGALSWEKGVTAEGNTTIVGVPEAAEVGRRYVDLRTLKATSKGDASIPAVADDEIEDSSEESK